MANARDVGGDRSQWSSGREPTAQREFGLRRLRVDEKRKPPRFSGSQSRQCDFVLVMILSPHPDSGEKIVCTVVPLSKVLS